VTALDEPDVLARTIPEVGEPEVQDDVSMVTLRRVDKVVPMAESPGR